MQLGLRVEKRKAHAVELGHSLAETRSGCHGKGRVANRGQLGYYHGHRGQEVDHEVGQVVVGVMGANEKEADGYGEQKLLGGGVLVAVVDLLPHVEVVIGAGVELEGHAAHPVEHEVGGGHVRRVNERPRRLLRHRGQDVVEDFEREDEYDVDHPRTCHAHHCRVSLAVIIQGEGRHPPFEFTHCEFRLGMVAWSLCCSKLSGGSWYIRLLLRRRRRFFSRSSILRSKCCTHAGCSPPVVGVSLLLRGRVGSANVSPDGERASSWPVDVADSGGRAAGTTGGGGQK